MQITHVSQSTVELVSHHGGDSRTSSDDVVVFSHVAKVGNIEHTKLIEGGIDATTFYHLSYCPSTGFFSYVHTKRGCRMKVGDRAGFLDNAGYIRLLVDGRKYQAHRVAWLLYYHVWPDGQVDHINNVRDDNRIDNLQVVTNRVNCGKRLSHFSPHGVGVSFDKRRGVFGSSAWYNGRNNYIGSFKTKEEAAIAYEVFVKSVTEKQEDIA